MTERSDESRILADIVSLARVLSDSPNDAFPKECIGGIAAELRYVDTLLSLKEDSWPEETAKDGSVVKRFVCFEFGQYLGIGEEIPVVDELKAILDVDGFSSVLSKYRLPDNQSLRAFYDSVIDRSAIFLLEYCGKVGKFCFDVDEFPPRFGSGSSSALEYETEGSPHTTWDAPGVAEHFLSLCSDALRGSAVQVVHEAYVAWVQGTVDSSLRSE